MLPSQTTEIHPQDPHMVEGENPFLKAVLWPLYAVAHAHMYRCTISKENSRVGGGERKWRRGEEKGEIPPAPAELPET